MKFRKKPVIVQAEQWVTEGTRIEGVFRESPSEGGRYYVITIHNQRAYLTPGDWIIKEKDGVHNYPCKPEIFEDTYEMV